MTVRSPLGTLVAAAVLSCSLVASVAVAAPDSAPAQASNADIMRLLDYARNQNSTGILVIQDGKILIEKYWPAPQGDRQFPLFVYGRSGSGALLEDVASQQKSFVAVLTAVAVDKGLLDVEKPVSAYVGQGWSKASPEQEAKIRVVDVLTMSSGLDDKFRYVAEPGTLFHYNTPVYAITKRVIAAAAGEPLETITQTWLTGPTGMTETAWRQRPAALASVGNDTGLVTTPRDTALFGQMILGGGIADNGTRVVSEAGVKAMFTRSATNPAYGRLWWLNGSDYVMRLAAGVMGAPIANRRVDGPLIAAAPSDTVAALGAFDRRLYVVPSRKLVIVRTGAAAGDKDFDEQFWLRLMKVIG